MRRLDLVASQREFGSWAQHPRPGRAGPGHNRILAPAKKRGPDAAWIALGERCAIDIMRGHRYSVRAIARELGGAPSTVFRELRRDLRPSGRSVPAPERRCATARRRRSRRNARTDGRGRGRPLGARRGDDGEHGRDIEATMTKRGSAGCRALLRYSAPRLEAGREEVHGQAHPSAPTHEDELRGHDPRRLRCDRREHQRTAEEAPRLPNSVGMPHWTAGSLSEEHCVATQT